MFSENPSEYELDMIEHQADMDAARINASLGDIETGGQFDFCKGCPNLDGHSPGEVADAQEYVGWSLESGLRQKEDFDGHDVDRFITRFPDVVEAVASLNS